MPSEFRPYWLVYLGLAGASLVGFNALVPGAGVWIALGIALWWALNTGAFDLVLCWLEAIRAKAGFAA